MGGGGVGPPRPWSGPRIVAMPLPPPLPPADGRGAPRAGESRLAFLRRAAALRRAMAGTVAQPLSCPLCDATGFGLAECRCVELMPWEESEE